MRPPLMLPFFSKKATGNLADGFLLFLTTISSI